MSLINLNIEAQTVEHLCSNCGKSQTTSVQTLRVGYHTNPHQICLPPCPCGSIEVIVRPRKNERAGVPITGARQLANALGELLVDLGRTRPPVPETDDPGYQASLDAGDLVGPAKSHDFGVKPVSDCADFRDTVAIGKANAEQLVAKKLLVSRSNTRKKILADRVAAIAAIPE